LMFTLAELAALWDIKQVLDPNNLLNPGKVFPLPTPSDAVEEQITAVQTPGKDDDDTLADTLNGGVFSPATAEEATEVLLAATRAHRSVYISGSTKAFTKHDAAMLLSTAALKGIKTYAPDDLYITVGAGTPLSEIQSFLT